MATLARRDDGELTRGFDTWCARRWPERSWRVVELNRPSSGWSNEMLLVTVGSDDVSPRAMQRFVVRLPPPLPTYPSYDLRAQARVLDALAAEGVPVPRVVALEHDDGWLGAPFLVMSREPGRPGAEAPALDPWIVDAPREQQRILQDGFVTVLAAIHRVDWRRHGLDAVLRGGGQQLRAETEWWTRYVEWASDGTPTAHLVDALSWCASCAPETGPGASLCWGDARLGNVLFGDDRGITAVLDWELASIGPGEMDLAWYLVLDELTNRFTGRTVPGFRPRAEVVERYERLVGRTVVDLAWHEIFALARSVAINERQARLAALGGVPYPGVAGDANPVLRHLARRIESYPAPPRERGTGVNRSR